MNRDENMNETVLAFRFKTKSGVYYEFGSKSPKLHLTTKLDGFLVAVSNHACQWSTSAYIVF